MIALGVDPSSNTTGLALVRGDHGSAGLWTVVHAAIWQPTKGDELSDRLWDLAKAVGSLSNTWGVDVVCVEKVHVTMNMDTVRKLAYHEAAAMIGPMVLQSPRLQGIMQVSVNHARKIAFGKNCKKEEAYELMTSGHPYVPWLPFNKGGSDQVDAAVSAVAGLDWLAS
jgi:Holliday junction resolvasome RuvABC endonuclease subunit